MTGWQNEPFCDGSHKTTDIIPAPSHQGSSHGNILKGDQVRW